MNLQFNKIGSKLSVVTAGVKDLDFLLALRLETMEAYLVKSGVKLSSDQHMKRVLYKFTGAKVIYHNQEKVGLLKTEIIGNKLEVIQFQIASHCQGLGLGSVVMNQVIQQAKDSNLKVVLRVLTVNPAVRLYKRLGFSVTGSANDSFLMEIA